MAGLQLSSSSHLILHHIPRLSPPLNLSFPSSPVLSFLLFKRLPASRLPAPPPQLRCVSSVASPLSSRPLSFPLPAFSLSSSHAPPLSVPKAQLTVEPEISGEYSDNDEYDNDGDDEAVEETTVTDPSERHSSSSLSTGGGESGPELPNLTVKEKKELASYAHSLGKKLKSQQVGKSGVTDSVASALIETLEANELLKIKIHNNCPAELEDAVKQLEQSTGSVVVGRIGRTVILYRPSLSKLKAEEKKKQAQRIFMRKRQRLTLKPSFEDNGPQLSGRGRRGSSRFVSSS
ncbi:uncharacterized protein LOC127795311 [Diospyros lotus]|uniref:uncharacterized protein LOC127795311 n=1 Tax=Diospyros lotus TaxID=55363 RepID=UPI00225824BD|nr:uncharacterized protein LOC127795311 [Diospyros lotus]